MKNKNTPELRFSEFLTTWKRCKFKDFTKLSQGLQIAIDKRYLTPGKNRLFYITNEFLNPNSKKTYYIESPSKNIMASKEDILMTRTGNTGKVVTNVEGVYHNNFFKVDYSDKETAKLFLYYLLNSFNVQKEITIRAGTSTIPDLNHNDFYKIIVNIPSIEEQVKIGNLLKELDQTIAFQQQELDNLKQTKQGFLQKIFPKEGDSTPEIRFPGFTEYWKIHELGNVVNITMGQSPKGKYYTKNPDDHILVQGNADIKNGWVSPRVWTTQITKLADKGDIILGVRAPVGIVGKTEYDVVLGRGVAGIKGNEFIFQWLSKMESDGFWERYSTGSTFESINSKILREATLSMPIEEEQTKIGNFFKQLDETIDLHQQELESLQETKQGFLQKMFV